MTVSLKIRRSLVFLFTGYVLVAGVAASGSVSTFTRKWSDHLPKVPELGPALAPQKLPLLARLKWYQKQEKWDKCLETSRRLLKKDDMELWVAAAHTSCLKQKLKTSGSEVATLMISFNQLKAHKKTLLDSPFGFHQKLLVTTYLEMAEKALEEEDKGLLVFLNLHYDIVESASDEHKSRYYEILGDWILKNGDKKLAGQNYLQSYNLLPSERLQKKMDALNVAYVKPKETLPGELVLSAAEDKAWKLVEKNKKRNRYVALAKVGVSYLNRFPGAPRTQEVANSMRTSLRRIIYKRQPRFAATKRSVLLQLQKAPGKYLMQWIQSIYGRGYYAETLVLAEAAVKATEVKGSAAEALIYGGKSAYFLTQWSVAEDYFRKLRAKYPGDKNSFEATYYLGLLLFRKKDFTAVIPLFEKFAESPGGDKWELQVRYWLWRSLQQIKSPRTVLQERVILKKFPLTYYGLRVRWETTKDLQSLLSGNFDPDLSVKYVWPPEELARWRRIKKLMASGWVREAGLEIDLLPAPTTGEGHLLRAQLWQQAQSAIRTMMALRTAIDLNPKLLSRPILEMAFPVRYQDTILKYGRIHEIDRDLILSVIRQESGFIEDAVSPSNAVGLMQLIPGTAKETAKWIKLKRFRWPESGLDPVTNIRMGTHYMRRMIKKYRGMVPMAMAAYNVGPGNMDRWLRGRTDLNFKTMGAEIVDDMWMDELPWSETSFYSKAILRNFLLYKIIFSKEKILDTPAWSGAQSMFPYGKSS